jgi:hypothetical protein
VAAAAVLGATLGPVPAHAAGGFTAEYGAADPLHGLGDGYSVSTYVTADIDGDGDLDVVAREPLGDTSIVALRNDGGTFMTTAVPFAGITFAANPANFVNTRVLVGDFDADGDVDLWHHGVGFGAFYRNDGATFSAQSGASDPLAALAGRDPGSYVVADVDGDSDPDVVVRDAATDASIDLLRNDGGTFVLTSAPFASISFAASASNFVNTCVLVLDGDGDGDVDLWHQGVGFAALYRNDGAAFSEHTGGSDPLLELGAYDTHSYVAMDVDSDADLDVVAREPVSDTAIDVLRNDGGSFTRLTGAASPFAAVTLATSDFTRVNTLVGDHDGDGDADLYNQALNELYRQAGSAPTTSTRAPASGEGGFAVTGDLALTFGEPVVLGSGAITLRDAATGAVVRRLDVDADASRFSGAGGATITVDPPTPLPFATALNVSVDPGAFVAAGDGDAFAGIAPTAWRFSTAANTAPALTALHGDSTTHLEGAPATPLDGATPATAIDADGAGFAGGELTAAVTGGAVAGEDRLAIGLFTGTTSVTVPLGPADDAAAVTGLLRAVTYANAGGDAPTAGPRTVTITLRDGGGLATTATVTVAVQAVDDPPVLAAPARVEAHAGSSVTLGPIAITDPDSAALDVRAQVADGTFGDGQVELTASGSPAHLTSRLSALTWRAPGHGATATLALEADDGTTLTTATVDLHVPAPPRGGFDIPRAPVTEWPVPILFAAIEPGAPGPRHAPAPRPPSTTEPPPSATAAPPAASAPRTEASAAAPAPPLAAARAAPTTAPGTTARTPIAALVALIVGATALAVTVRAHSRRTRRADQR